jgi:curved DNA-binding protein CbpA
MAENYYDILEVSPQAGAGDIKKAYRALALRFHPDRNPRNRHFFERRFRLINEAYDVLGSPQKRDLYDRSIRPGNDNVARASWLSSLAVLFRSGKRT